ncbi:hypothetical protein KSP39_PZI007825 [Platanthera zijinensis]|uniref:Uncharacterized protein n=1 Tax=Platanthera zijinensis TaxID=2320716 RepID=A0AAP0G8J2_9ASPA
MGQQPQESPLRSSDKFLWSQIYKTLKDMFMSQQSHIEALINDREFLVNNVHFLESHIAQMKEEQAKTRLVEDARMAVFVGFKESEALCRKMQLDLAESDLEDFRSCMEAESIEMGELKEKLKSFGAAENADYSNNVSGPSGNLNGKDQSVASLKKEIKKRKHSHRELSSRKDAEISALLAEKDFVWNQFKKMENYYIALLKSKRAEANEKDEIIAKLEAERGILKLEVRKHVEQRQLADLKMEKISSDMDELRSSAMVKENVIENLKEEISKLTGGWKKNIQDNSRGKSKYAGKLQSGPSMVIETQSGSRKRYLNSCDAGTSYKRRSSHRVTFEKPTPSNVLMPHQGLIGQRGRRTPSLEPLQSPLFHSDFKVPKLKKSARLEP